MAARASGSWSAVRKYLEEEMLSPALKGRVRYNRTTYPNMDGCGLFEIYIDKKLFKQFSWETVNSYFIKKNLKENNNPKGRLEYWEGFHSLLAEIPVTERDEYTDEEFADALGKYRNQPISASLGSENPLIAMFALLDRRSGKRSFQLFEGRLAGFPDWLSEIYRLRMNS